METLADLAPKNRKSPDEGGGTGDGTGTAEVPGTRPGRAKPVSAEEQAAWDERVAHAQEEREGRGTIAPLVVAGVAVLGVVGLIVWSTLSSSDPVTVDTMPTPVVAADGAGSAVYPANSLEAVRENVRFGFAPAVDLVVLGDGTVVLGEGGPDDGEDVFGKPYSELTQETFADGEIPAPREDTDAGTPATWAEVYRTYADDTIFMPAVDTQGELDAVLTAAEDADRIDSLIIRTADDETAARANDRNVSVLYVGEADETSPEELLRAGYDSVAANHDSEAWESWTHAELDVWVTGVSTPDEYDDAVSDGARGAVVADPFAITAEQDD
ncbi:hypothetical protein [Brevibacterium yomogidense]|uniref:hypothetical protein n=1 Tax=Brevibacterium yomogidense TaxID=946573 RepID=UPI0018E00E4D|nr:hypothetical protein [Brevibacterium yomogidense]